MVYFWHMFGVFLVCLWYIFISGRDGISGNFAISWIWVCLGVGFWHFVVHCSS